MLLSGLVFIGWVFSTLVSAFSLVLRMDVGSVCYLVGNFSGVLELLLWQNGLPEESIYLLV